MRRLVLSFLCLMAAFGLFGQTERELTQNKENYLTKRNEVWFDYFSNISIYKDCPAVEQICRELLGVSGQQSLKEFVEGRIQTYDTKIPYSDSKFEELKRQGFVGHDYMIVRPKGKPVGNCQPFEIVRTYQDEGMEKKSIMLWTFLYDQKNDKVLTVDDVFVPEKAAELKEKAGEDYISLFAKDGKIYFGSTIANDYIMYKTLQFIQDADKLTDQFKQAVAFDKLMTEHQRAEEERAMSPEQKMQLKIKEYRENNASTAYRRVFNDFGELYVRESVQVGDIASRVWEADSTFTELLAGKHVLEIVKNDEGTTDSLWVSSIVAQLVRKALSYTRNMVRFTQGRTKSRYIGEETWSLIVDIDRPVVPEFERILCQLLLNKKSKDFHDAEDKFIKTFWGKKIGEELANAILITGSDLTTKTGKYFSYAYSRTYAVYEGENVRKESKNIDPNKIRKLEKPVQKNIIYDIRNQKVLSLSDVLTIEEIANLGLKKKTKADLALDNCNLYVGIDGKPVCTYPLSRENWNKFTPVLQDLIGPFDNLPTKMDTSLFVFEDYEGVQPKHVSLKINQEPSFGGHVDSLLVYMKSHLTLPDNMKNENTWELRFVVGKDGRVSNVETHSNTKGNVEEAFASQLTEAFKQMPAWKPLDLAGFGTQKALMAYDIKFVPYSKLINGDAIYDESDGYSELAPAFPGGNAAMPEWLREHIKYPQKCQELGIQGTVITRFVVEKDGSIGEIEIVQSPDPDLSQEAVRVIKAMPKWTPAMENGKPARTRFNFPIEFRLH